jgi:hypothetical protein
MSFNHRIEAYRVCASPHRNLPDQPKIDRKSTGSLQNDEEKERKQHDEILNAFSVLSPEPVHHPSIARMDDEGAAKDDKEAACGNPR